MTVERAPTQEEWEAEHGDRCQHGYHEHGHSPLVSDCHALIEDGSECLCFVQRDEPFAVEETD